MPNIIYPLTLDFHNNLVDQSGYVIATPPLGNPEALVDFFKHIKNICDVDSDVFLLLKAPLWLN